MTVAIVVDSAAALPAAVAEPLGIRIVPLALTIGGTDYRDGEVDLDELLRRLDEGVSTSSPAPGDFAAAIEEALADHDGVVVLTVSSDMSATYNAARVAAQTLADLGGEASAVRVVDTGTAAGGEALVTVAAARSARAGDDLDAVEAVANKVAGEVSLVATVDQLDRLIASGRLPRPAGWAGKRLGVNPLFAFRTGQVHPMRPAFSRDAALDRIVKDCLDSRPTGAVRLHAAALHAHAEDAARHLLDTVTGEAGDVEVDAFVGPFSPVMVSHTGPGLAGLAWWWEA